MPTVYVGANPATELEFRVQADKANPATLAQLWSEALARPPGAERQWRLGMLESVPGHKHFDRKAAIQHLTRLRDDDTAPTYIANLAALRLQELTVQDSAVSECRAEIEALHKRLDAVVEIERALTTPQE